MGNSVFQELWDYLTPYKNHVHFHDRDAPLLLETFLGHKNKIFVCSQIGDLFPFNQLIPFLDRAKDDNNFYIFLTASEPPEFADQYKQQIKFFFIPSFYSWYTKFLVQTPNDKNIEKHFLSTNYRNDFARLSLFFYFIRNNLLDKSFFSYVGEIRPEMSNCTIESFVKQGADFYLNEFDIQTNDKIINVEEVTKLIPYVLDKNPIPYDWSLNLYEFYNKSFLSIVVESYCGANSPFFTEKIWKPIAMKQPFILMNSKFSLKFLQELGFKTFDGIIDETYDTLDNPERWEAIFRETKRISNFSIKELKEKHKQLQNVLDHNYNHFYNVLPNIYQTEIAKAGQEIDILIQNKLQSL